MEVDKKVDKDEGEEMVVLLDFCKVMNRDRVFWSFLCATVVYCVVLVFD